MSKIVVLGSCSVDYTTYAPRLPVPGETVHGTKFAMSYGGKGANQAVAAAKLSAKVAMIAKVGDDIWGDKYANNMRAHGIDTAHVYVAPDSHTGIAQITVGDAGDNQIVIVAGANGGLSAADVDRAADAVRTAAVLLCQLETPVEATLRAFQICDKGIKILNAAPAVENLSAELLSLTTILCVNETEAATLTGKRIESIEDAESATARLLSMGCEMAIISLGPRGAVFANRSDRTPRRVECPVVNAVDTTGAGDAFLGALAALLLLEPSAHMEDVIGAACRAASHSVGGLGTQESYITTPGELLLRSHREKSALC